LVDIDGFLFFSHNLPLRSPLPQVVLFTSVGLWCTIGNFSLILKSPRWLVPLNWPPGVLGPRGGGLCLCQAAPSLLKHSRCLPYPRCPPSATKPALPTVLPQPAGGPSYVSSRTLCRILKSKDQVPLPISGVVHLVQCYGVLTPCRGHPFKPAAVYDVPVAMFACNALPVPPMPKIIHRSPKPVTPSLLSRLQPLRPTPFSPSTTKKLSELKLSFVKRSALNVGHVPPSFLDPHTQNMPGRFDVSVLYPCTTL
jgi:hypothetical protein